MKQADFFFIYIYMSSWCIDLKKNIKVYGTFIKIKVYLGAS